MWVDPIVEEVRAVRNAHAARFDYDLDAIYQDLKEQEQQGQHRVIVLSPKRVKAKTQEAGGRKKVETKPMATVSPVIG